MLSLEPAFGDDEATGTGRTAEDQGCVDGVPWGRVADVRADVVADATAARDRTPAVAARVDVDFAVTRCELLVVEEAVDVVAEPVVAETVVADDAVEGSTDVEAGDEPADEPCTSGAAPASACDSCSASAGGVLYAGGALAGASAKPAVAAVASTMPATAAAERLLIWMSIAYLAPSPLKTASSVRHMIRTSSPTDQFST